MVSLKLGSKAFRALDGKTYEEVVKIERETAKAILLSVTKRGKTDRYWFPKSQITVTDHVTIPTWLWEKREAV